MPLLKVKRRPRRFADPPLAWGQINDGHEPGRRFLFRYKSLQADEYGLRLQLDAPDFFDSALDLVLQREDLGGGGSAAIHNGKSVLAGDSCVAEVISTAESRVLHQPCRGDFPVSLQCRITWNRQALAGCSTLQVLVLVFGEHRILEE